MHTARFKPHFLTPLSLNAGTVAAVALWLMAGSAPGASAEEILPRSPVRSAVRSTLAEAAAMDAPLVPGAPRAWENGVDVTPHSAVNLVNGNVITVIPTTSLETTAITAERIAFREQLKKDHSILSRSAKKGMTNRERMCYIVEGLLDSGPKKAEILIDHFGSPGSVFEAIKNTKITYTRTGNPKGIAGPLEELSGFGWKFVSKNQEILFGTNISQDIETFP